MENKDSFISQIVLLVFFCVAVWPLLVLDHILHDTFTFKFMIFFRSGPITRSITQLIETVEVHFHVLVSKDFVKNVSTDLIMMQFQDKFFGQWTSLIHQLHPKEWVEKKI